MTGAFYGSDNSQQGPAITTTGRDGTFIGYGAGGNSGSGFQLTTRAADRAAVNAGSAYSLTFRLANDFADASPNPNPTAKVTLSFFGNTAPEGAGLLPGPSGTYQLSGRQGPGGSQTNSFTEFTLTGIAPAGATFAGATIDVPVGSGYLFDGFSLTPVTEPTTVGLAAAGGLALVRLVRRRLRSQV